MAVSQQINDAAKIRRKIYKLEDLTVQDFNMLKQAYFLSQNDPNIMMCFGRYYFKLRQLGLIDNEAQITFDGKALIKEYISKVEN